MEDWKQEEIEGELRRIEKTVNDKDVDKINEDIDQKYD